MKKEDFKVGQVVGGKKIKDIHNRCAEGEVTGHFHGTDSNAFVLEYEDGTRDLFVGDEGTELTHQEHNPISFAPGAYDIRIVKEVDPMEDLVRNVRD